MWSELNGGLNSDGFYYTTATNRGYLVTPDRTIEANKEPQWLTLDTSQPFSTKENTGVVYDMFIST